VLEGLEAKDRVCYRSGDDKDQYDGFEGNMYVSASNETRPVVRDTNGKDELSQIDGKPYGGCYVYGTVDIWAQDNNYGKRINAKLRTVTFFRDGDAFSGSSPVTDDEFEDLSEGADADDEDELDDVA
jgi:hypothetical protein